MVLNKYKDKTVEETKRLLGVLKKNERAINSVIKPLTSELNISMLHLFYVKMEFMHRFQNHILRHVANNISDTFADISIHNRAQTRNKLIFSGSSLFDIQFLYPLYSDLTYQASTLSKSYSEVSFTR